MTSHQLLCNIVGPIGDLVATSAIGVNCWPQRDHKAVAAYV